ncbi:MAG: hypothetical protein ACI4SZ_00715 [Lachnospiraceae bacterium]
MKKLSIFSARIYTKTVQGEWVRLKKVRAEKEEGGCVLIIPRAYYRMSDTGEFCMKPSALWLHLRRMEPVKLCCLHLSAVTELRKEIVFTVVRNETGEYLRILQECGVEVLS